MKPLRTEADHEAALGEVGRLWGAASGTAEVDRLDVLATLIGAYDAAHHPMDPPDPIAASKFRMEQQGLTLCAPSGAISRTSTTPTFWNRA